MTTPSPSLITRKRLCLDRLVFKIIDVWHRKPFPVILFTLLLRYLRQPPPQCFFDAACIKPVLYPMRSPWSKRNVVITWKKTRFRQRQTSKHSEKPEEAEYQLQFMSCMESPSILGQNKVGFAQRIKNGAFFHWASSVEGLFGITTWSFVVLTSGTPAQQS